MSDWGFAWATGTYDSHSRQSGRSTRTLRLAIETALEGKEVMVVQATTAMCRTQMTHAADLLENDTNYAGHPDFRLMASSHTLGFSGSASIKWLSWGSRQSSGQLIRGKRYDRVLFDHYVLETNHIDLIENFQQEFQTPPPPPPAMHGPEMPVPVFTWEGF